MKKESLMSFLEGKGRKFYLSKGIRYCGKSFKNTRSRLLKICEQEVEPAKKWEKSKKLLLENLDSQIPIHDRFVENIIKSIEIDNGDRFDSLFFEPLKKLCNILANHSFVKECINTVAIYNANDDLTSNIPDNVKALQYGYLTPESYYLSQDTTLVRVFLKSGEFRDFYLDNEEVEKFDTHLYKLVYFIENNNSESKDGRREDFFHAFKGAFPEKVTRHNFDKNTEPKKLMDMVKPNIALFFIKSFTGSNKDIEEFGFYESYEEETFDRDKFQELKLNPEGINEEEIQHISVEPHPKWQPDNKYLNSTLMSYELAEDYLKTLPINHRVKCLFNSSRYLGYKIFELASFRAIINTWKTDNCMSELRILTNNLSSLYLGDKKVKDTQYKYWRIYFETEKLVKAGYSKKKAFLILSEKYNMKQSTISTRYKEKASEAKKNDLSDWDIVHKLNINVHPEII